LVVAELDAKDHPPDEPRVADDNAEPSRRLHDA
jgi:hypothetical protein